MRQDSPIFGIILALPFMIMCAAVLLVVLASDNGSDTAVVDTQAPTRTLSHSVAIVATINAAPARPARQPVASGPSEAFLAMGVAAEHVTAGETGFASLCAACHGVDARGMPNLGKDLVGTEFIAGVSNDELLDFVKVGRPIWDAANTTGVDMPPKGGNPALSDEEIVNIIYYLRSLDPAYEPSEADIAALAVQESTPEPLAVQPTAAAATAAPAVAAASAAPEEPSEQASSVDTPNGADLFFGTCSACHGPDGRGLPNLGKDLVTSEFIAGTSDEDLLTFVKMGRPLWDPANTTGIDMPPKGGNPALSDEDIMSIIAYLRSIQE